MWCRDLAQAEDQSTMLVLLQLASLDGGPSSGWMLSPLSHFQPHLAAAPQISSVPALTRAQSLQLSQQDKITAWGVRLPEKGLPQYCLLNPRQGQNQEQWHSLCPFEGMPLHKVMTHTWEQNNTRASNRKGSTQRYLPLQSFWQQRDVRRHCYQERRQYFKTNQSRGV